MSFEKKLKRVSQRDWLVIKDLWIPYSGHLNGSGAPPNTSPEEVLTAQVNARELPLDGEKRVALMGLHEAVLSDAVYALHRAAHVLGAAETHVSSGILTWSISNAYHSAFLALDALLKFLGVCIVTAENVQLVIDIWPEPASGLSQAQRRRYAVGSESNIIRNDRFDHFHRWAILQRTLNTLKNAPVRADLISILCSLGSRSFARQRNELHYLGRWYFDDLFVATPSDTFCRAEGPDAVVAGLAEDAQSFSYYLAAAIVFMGQELLRDIAAQSPAAQLDFERFACSSSSALHPLLNASSIEAAWKAA